MVEFFIVSKCPMEGLYKNEKLARQVSASYQEAVIKRFEAPEEIPAARNPGGAKVLRRKPDYRSPEPLAVHYGQGEGTGSR